MALTRPKVWDLDTNIEFLADPVTVLNATSSQANIDVGFLINRAGGLVANTAIYWNESGNTFALAYTTASGSNNSNISVSSYANLQLNTLNATGVSTSSITATNYYYPNGTQVGAGTVNTSLALAKSTATNTANVLVDSVSTTGNSSVIWAITAVDNVKANVISANTITTSTIYVTSNAAAGTTTRVEYNIPHPFMLMGAG
jgi:hypothetical protein